MVWADGAEEPFVLASFGVNSGVRVAAITGTDCARGTASDCAYFVSYYDTDAGQPVSARLSGDGASSDVDPDRSILAVRDATDSGRVLGITEFDDSRPGTCSVVLDPAESGSTPLLSTCDYAFDDFSPDGSYVLASDTYGDGFGSGAIAIFATAGDRLAYRVNRGPDMVTYNDAVWEDETHVLFTRYQDGKWSIVRMDVHGALEYAVPPQKGGDVAPWRFSHELTAGHTRTVVTGSDESAGRSSDEGVRPRATSSAPSAATIAPLSVHSPGRGTRTRIAPVGGALGGHAPAAASWRRRRRR